MSPLLRLLPHLLPRFEGAAGTLGRDQVHVGLRPGRDAMQVLRQFLIQWRRRRWTPWHLCQYDSRLARHDALGWRRGLAATHLDYIR